MPTKPNPMTPESRAKELVERYDRAILGRTLMPRILEGLITAALIEAENDKLEEAAALIEKPGIVEEQCVIAIRAAVPQAHLLAKGSDLKDYIATKATEIRSLKSKD